jgi:hypothetical protein
MEIIPEYALIQHYSNKQTFRKIPENSGLYYNLQPEIIPFLSLGRRSGIPSLTG